MPKPQVLQVNKAYYPHTGGIEAVVQALAEGLVRRDRFGCRVLACGAEKGTRHAHVNGVPVTYAGSLGTLASLPVSPTFPYWLDRQRADILQLHLPFPLADLSLWLLSFLRRIGPETGVVLWWHSDVVRQRWALPIYGPLLRWLLRRADRILVASPNHITSSSFLPEFSDKCRVVPYGIAPDVFEPSDDVLANANDLRQQYGERIALFVGRLVYYKGLEYVIEAMASVPDGCLLIAGSGPMREQLADAAQRAGVADRVHFLGAVSDEYRKALYHASDVFVLPSTEKSEAFGIVQLEAMTCGKPVVSTDLPTGVTYVNRDGVTGLTVPVRDSARLAQALCSLLADRQTALRMGGAAKARVKEEFTVDRMVEQAEQVYRDVLEERCR